MSGEDQERFEDYLELEKYIEQLQAGQVAHPPKELTPEQANIYQMANLLRSMLPNAVEPDPAFAAQLYAELEQEADDMREATQPRPAIKPQNPPPEAPVVETEPAPEPVNAPVPIVAQEVSSKSPQEIQQATYVPGRRSRLSRRNLLAGGAAAAASLAVGVGLGRVMNQPQSQPPTKGTTQTPYTPVVPGEPLVTSEIPTTWYHAATVAQLKENAVPFKTDVVVGYVIWNNDKDTGESADPDQGKIIAFSAACTHMGCIVQWEKSDRKFHCPCHGGLFTEYGKVDAGSGTLRYLYPLPRLETKVENNNVYVKVPLKQG